MESVCNHALVSHMVLIVLGHTFVPKIFCLPKLELALPPHSRTPNQYSLVITPSTLCSTGAGRSPSPAPDTLTYMYM